MKVSIINRAQAILVVITLLESYKSSYMAKQIGICKKRQNFITTSPRTKKVGYSLSVNLPCLVCICDIRQLSQNFHKANEIRFSLGLAEIIFNIKFDSYIVMVLSIGVTGNLIPNLSYDTIPNNYCTIYVSLSVISGDINKKLTNRHLIANTIDTFCLMDAANPSKEIKPYREMTKIFDLLNPT